MEKIKENLPIFSVALLIIGTINLVVYYNFFHVDILSYLDFTEVLQIQFRLFAIAVAVMFGQLVYTITSVHFFQKITVINKDSFILNRFIDKIDKWMVKIIGKRTNAKIGVAFLLMTLLMVILLSVQAPKMFYMYLITWSIGLCFIIINLFYNAFKKEILEERFQPDIDTLAKDREKFKSNLKLLRTILGFIFITYISAVLAVVFAMDTVLYSASNEATVITDKTTFNTSANYRFIGRTKNFIFFYDIPRQQAEVFPNADIKKLYLRDGIRHEDKQDSLYAFHLTRAGLADWLKKANRKMR